LHFVLTSEKLLPLFFRKPVVCATTPQDGNVLGGSFRLSFHGQTTASIAYNAAAAQLQTALEDVSEIGGVTVVR
jgi:hypothetical protein